MKIKEVKDLTTKTVKELETLVSKKKLELVKNTVKIAGGKEKNLKVAWTLRKEIAQIMTVLKLKGLEEK
jgi:ribosomal protein L29